MKEYKYIPLTGFKGLDEGNGKLEGYPSVFGDIDSYGDIIPKGAYQNTIEDFKQNGFIAHSHDWDVTGAVAMPVEVREDEYGLFCVAEFHSTQDAQDVRTKVRERLAAGKSVGLSIGFSMNSAPSYIYRKDYETELPKYLDPTRLGELMEKAKGFDKLRILSDIKLYEYSIVTTPAQKIAQVTSAKSEGESEVKSYFGEYVEEMLTISACSSLTDILFWCVLYQSIYDESKSLDEKLAMVSEGLDEYKGHILKACKALLEGKGPESMDDAKGVFESLFADPKIVQNYKSSLEPELGLIKQAELMVSANNACITRMEERKNFRVKEGRELSSANRNKLKELSEQLGAGKSTLDALIEATEPQPKMDGAQQAYTQYLANVRKVKTRI